MSKSLLILGRQPALGLAELESLYGADTLRAAGKEAAVLALDSKDVDFARLGGSIKLCRIFGSIETTKWPEIQRHVEQKFPELAATMPEGKITLGLSAYGLDIKPQQLLAAGLTIKKQLRGVDRSIRLVPNQTTALNSAQVLHNKLTSENGSEIVLVRDGDKTVITRTVAEQDIESYTLRDRGRPKRDARVGMLPPKLAQIIINLAGKHVPPSGAKIDPNHPVNKNPRTARLLDPFCGTGVILQEALLDGYSTYGTDIEQRMIDYSRSNLEWLTSDYYNLGRDRFELATGDATSFQWKQPIDLVACEAYLGQPFNTLPSSEKLEQVRGTCNAIIEKFLTNIRRQLLPGTRLCLAVPAWRISMSDAGSRKSEVGSPASNFVHLPLIDQLNDLGYNRVRFEHVRDDQLLYYREDQIVARQLLVLTKQ